MAERRAPVAAAAAPHRSSVAGFLLSRWRGEVPLRRALWWDMWCVGSVVNLASGLLALLLIARDAPAAVGAAVFFSPLPYNLLLVASVWRSAARRPGPPALAAQLLALAWLAIATLL